jgi:hypothetical protein
MGDQLISKAIQKDLAAAKDSVQAILTACESSKLEDMELITMLSSVSQALQYMAISKQVSRQALINATGTLLCAIDVADRKRQ